MPNLTSPARTDGAFREKAASSAGAGRSVASTSVQLVRAALHDDAFGPFLSVSIGDAERSLGEVSSTFGSILPPSTRSQDLQDRLMAVLDVTAGDVAEARIAIRHGDTGPLPDILRRLRTDADRLSSFEARLS